MSQSEASTYGFNLDVAQAGQKYDLRPDVVQSFAAEEAIEPGQPVQRGTDPENQVLVGDETTFLGIALFTHTLTQPLDSDGAQYDIGEAVSVLTGGAAYVTSSVSDVVAGETAYVTAAGEYTNVEGSNLAIGTFITSGGENDLVVVELS